MESLIMHPKNQEQLTALKAIATAFKINFEADKFSENDKTVAFYGKEVAEKIKRGEADIKAGRVTRIKDVNNIWESIL